jgi:hypothetical protein
MWIDPVEDIRIPDRSAGILEAKPEAGSKGIDNNLRRESPMTTLRKAGWFVVLAVAMASWIGVLGSLRGVAEAAVISSGLPETDGRAQDITKIQSFLENKIVMQKLVDYGVSPEEAKAKVREMSTQDLHRLASLTDRAAAGTDSGLGLLIGIAVLIILVLVILKLSHKEVIIR